MLRKSLDFCLLLFFMIVPLFFVSSCTWLKQQARIAEYTHWHVAKHLYNKPLNELWPEVEEWVSEQGYELRESIRQYSIETRWLADTVLKSSKRYLIQGFSEEDGYASRVEIIAQTRTSDGISGGRSPEAEWELLQSIDPDTAREIEKKGRSYAKDRLKKSEKK